MRTSLSNNIALNLPASALDQPSPHDALVEPLQLSPRLHNSDLAPTKAEGRRWGKYSIFALWTNDVHNIANYSALKPAQPLRPAALDLNRRSRHLQSLHQRYESRAT